jgi:hypothetical protein
MDRKELISKLETFKQTCHDKGYIKGEIYLDEAYPGIIPTSFIVKMLANQSWLDGMGSPGKALRELLEVLWETTDAKTRENVFTLSIYDENERHLLETDQRKAAWKKPRYSATTANTTARFI